MAEARKMGKSELFAHFAERFEWKRTQAREFFEYHTELSEKELKRSEAKAGDVRTRIKDIERVANALFKEWNAELKTYSSAELRRASEQQLNDTKRQYEQLLGVMRQAESRMEPVLAVFRDQVLFLKHNLNARAIASLQDTSAQIRNDVVTLVKEMEASIAEADAFIAQMRTEPLEENQAK